MLFIMIITAGAGELYAAGIAVGGAVLAAGLAGYIALRSGRTAVESQAKISREDRQFKPRVNAVLQLMQLLEEATLQGSALILSQMERSEEAGARALLAQITSAADFVAIVLPEEPMAAALLEVRAAVLVVRVHVIGVATGRDHSDAAEQAKNRQDLATSMGRLRRSKDAILIAAHAMIGGSEP